MLIQPLDLTYLGAFRLPGDAPDEVGWLWSGEALTYYSKGDSEVCFQAGVQPDEVR